MKSNLKYRISIDAMGGDHGLNTTVPASINALKKYKNLYISLVGNNTKIEKHLKKYKTKYKNSRLKIIHAEDVVAMHDKTITALKKKNSSMRVAIEMIKNKTVDACISAGNTGALMANSKLVLKMLPTIERPAIVYAMPCLNKNKICSFYMLDLGANVDCSPKQLYQFAIMGSILSEHIKNKIKPSVALLNIGKEQIKGLENIKQAAKILKNSNLINYIGYIESNSIFEAKADVVVCDGFAGNIALKASEGTVKFIKSIIKQALNKTIFSKIISILAIPIIKKLKYKLNINKYNGASLLGIQGIVIKSHGNASEEAFSAAIQAAMKEIKYNIPDKIKNNIQSVVNK